MKEFINRNALLLYFTIAFAISWGGILLSFGQNGPHIFHGQDVLAGKYSSQLILIWLSMLAGPSISGIFLTATMDGKRGLKDLLRLMLKWKIHIKWYGLAILLFPATLLLIFYCLSFVSVKYYPSSLLMPGLLIGVIGGFFEEIGWTGFATARLLSRFNFTKTAVILGVIHSFWHLFADYLGGVDFYKSLYIFHFFLWIIALTALRFFIIWIYEHTGSVLLAILTHASFTGSQLIITPSQLNGPETILWYLIFAVALTILGLLTIKSNVKSMFFYSKRRTI
jgi:membrane protease YdiL (CAAX protease family)